MYMCMHMASNYVHILYSASVCMQVDRLVGRCEVGK